MIYPYSHKKTKLVFVAMLSLILRLFFFAEVAKAADVTLPFPMFAPFKITYDDTNVSVTTDSDQLLHFDYLETFYIDYTGSNTGKMSLTVYDEVTYDMLAYDVIMDVTRYPVNSFRNFYEINSGTGSLPYGTHYLFFSSSRTIVPISDSAVLYITIDSIRSSITSNPANPSTGYNPVSFNGTGTYGDPANSTMINPISNVWTLTKPDHTILNLNDAQLEAFLDYTGTILPPEGSYTLELSGDGKTVNGTTVPAAYLFTDTTTFQIRYPDPTITIDQASNPTSITGAAKIAGSTLSWKILNSTGFVVASNTGDTIPPASLQSLTSGTYTVEFSELSPENITITHTDTFSIASQSLGSYQVIHEFYNESMSSLLSTSTGPVKSGTLNTPHPATQPLSIKGYAFVSVNKPDGKYSSPTYVITYKYKQTTSTTPDGGGSLNPQHTPAPPTNRPGLPTTNSPIRTSGVSLKPVSPGGQGTNEPTIIEDESVAEATESVPLTSASTFGILLSIVIILSLGAIFISIYVRFKMNHT